MFSGWGVEGKRSERRGQEQEVQKRLERDGEMAFAERTDLHCDCGMGIKGFFFGSAVDVASGSLGEELILQPLDLEPFYSTQQCEKKS